MAEQQYPNFNVQSAPLQNGAIPTYPTQSVAPIASNPLNTYSQVQGSLQATQNMRNQSQQMKRDQISFNEQQRASQLRARQLLQQNGGTPEQMAQFDKDGTLPGEQPHQGFMQGITQALAHGMHALSGLVHGGGQGGTNPSGIPYQPQQPPDLSGLATPQSPAPPDQAPDTYEDGGVVTKSSGWDLAKQAVKEAHDALFGASDPPASSAPIGSGAAQQAAQQVGGRQQQIDNTVDDMSKMRGGPITDRAPVAPAFMQPPTVGDPPGHHPKIMAFSRGGAIPHYDGGGAVLNTYAQSGVANDSPNTAPKSGAGDGGGGGGIPGLPAMPTSTPTPSAPASAAGNGTGGDVSAASGAGAMSFFQDGGAVPAYGVEAGGVRGLRGFAEGGAVPGSAEAVAAGGSPVPNPQANFIQATESWASHLHSLALDDAGQPGNARGIPATGPVPVPGVSNATPVEVVDQTEGKLRQDSGGFGADGKPVGPTVVDMATPAPATGRPPSGTYAARAATQGAPSPEASAAATAAVVKAAPTDATALAGVVSTTPASEGRPKSITPIDWEKSDQGIAAAAAAGALAGHDGAAIADSLNANRNAWVQGHVLRWLSVANTQLATGNSKGVIEAMKNAYYYIPDGNELQISKDKDGNLMLADLIDPPGPDGKPIMRPVNAQSLQQMGAALLDPQNVNSLVMGARTSAAQAAERQAHGQYFINKGQAALETAGAAGKNAATRAANQPSESYKNFAEGEAQRIRATAEQTRILQAKGIDPNLAKEAAGAGDDVEKAIQGQLDTAPGAGDPNNLNPSAGKTFRDTSKSALPSATPMEIQTARGLAGNIYVAGAGAVSRGEAARLALLGVQAQRAGSMHKPISPTDKPENFHLDPNGTVHIWNPSLGPKGGYEVTHVPTGSTASSIASSAGSVAPVAPLTPSASGGAGVPPETAGNPGAETAEEVEDGKVE